VTEDLKALFVSEEVQEFEIEHEGKKWKFKIKELPWLKVNQLLGKALKISQTGIEVQLDSWYENYLIEALVEAPWQLSETRLALRKLGPKFGAKLEKKVPRPESFVEDIDFFVRE